MQISKLTCSHWGSTYPCHFSTILREHLSLNCISFIKYGQWPWHTGKTKFPNKKKVTTFFSFLPPWKSTCPNLALNQFLIIVSDINKMEWIWWFYKLQTPEIGFENLFSYLGGTRDWTQGLNLATQKLYQIFFLL
jgi:hypothetical protein